MRQVEAEFLILHEWESWRANNPTRDPAESLRFLRAPQCFEYV